jgi:hypothetical protein
MALKAHLRDIYEFHASRPCAVEGCDSWFNREMDHIDPGTKTKACSKFGYWASQPGSRRERIDRYGAELNKCQPLCVLHHRMKSIEQSASFAWGNHEAYHRRQRKRQMAKDYMIEQKACHDCRLAITKDNVLAFDFDHRPGYVKKGNLAKLCYGSRRTFFLEVAKCDVVCCNCHKARTDLRRRYVASHYFAPCPEHRAC